MLNPEKYLEKQNKDFENLLLKTKLFKLHDPKDSILDKHQESESYENQNDLDL